MFYAIQKDGKLVRDFSDGAEFTNRVSGLMEAEVYRSKKSAAEAARRYSRRYGKGYTVVEI